jgi:cytochrome c553
MMAARWFIAAGAAVSVAAGVWPAGAAAQAGKAAASQGAQLASAGLPAKGVAACAGCHGAKGEGNAAANFPRLAGQGAEYMTRQLEHFASGKRNNPIMAPIAKGLTPAQRGAVSAYYAALESPAAPGANPAGGAAERGRVLAEAGDEKLGLQACANCHGPAGRGEPPVFPYLAGLAPGYLGASLNDWKSGARDTDPSGQMREIGKRLQADDIAALAAYFSTQAPPVRSAAATPQPPLRGKAAKGKPAGPTSGTRPAQGSGTEQGSPVTEGTQGPGSAGSGTGKGR